MPARQLVSNLAATQRPTTSKYNQPGLSATLQTVYGIPMYPTNSPIESILGQVPLGGAYADILAYARGLNFPTFRFSASAPQDAVIVLVCCLVIQPFPMPLLLAFLYMPGGSTTQYRLMLPLMTNTVANGPLSTAPGAGGALQLLTGSPYNQPVDALLPFFPPKSIPPNPYVVQVTLGRIPWIPAETAFDNFVAGL